MCGTSRTGGGFGHGIDMLEDMGAVSKTGSSKDLEISQADLEDDQAPASGTKRSKKSKTKSSSSDTTMSGTNPLNKSNTGLSIYRS